MKNKLILSFLVATLALTLQGGYIGYVYPAGAKAGTTCELVLGGRGHQGIQGVIIDGDERLKGLTVEACETVPGNLYNFHIPAQRRYLDKAIRALFKGKPLPQLPEDTNLWRMNSKYLTDLPGLSPLQREMLVRGFYFRIDPLQASPSISQKIILRLKIAPDAPQGLHQLRFIGSQKRPMFCNPIPFFIGNADEFQKPRTLPPPDKEPISSITLPSNINGQLLPGQTDYYHFKATRNQVITFKLYGRALLPFIGDGVPGHFQPTLQVKDSKGRQVAFCDDTYFDPDPTLTFTVPADDTYTLVVADALCRGREDFVYRVHAQYGAIPYQLTPPSWKLPIQEKPAKLTLPAAIHGTIQPKQCHSYPVQLHKGQEVVLEIWARRGRSPLDTTITILDSKGKQLAMNDDMPRPKAGPIYHHADPYLRFTPEADGLYTIQISDLAGAGGKDYQYWLRIDKPHPDFTIWAVPSAIQVPINGRGTVPLGFVVERLDGLKGDIHLQLKNDTVCIAGVASIPDGDKHSNSFESVCGLQLAFPDCTREYVTLTTRPKTKRNLGAMKITATCGGITHDVMPMDESMQAFAYNHLIPAADFRYLPSWSNCADFQWENTKNIDAPIQMTAGCCLTLRIKTTEKNLLSSVSAELFAPPAGLRIKECKLLSPTIIQLTLQAEVSMKPARFNQIIQINVQQKRKEAKTGKERIIKRSTYLPARRIHITK